MKTLQQLELFTAPVDSLQARVDAALLSSLHSYCDADERWSKRRKHGLTDVELKEAIACEFGIYGGSSLPESHTHQGGADPKFWLSNTHQGKPTLSGKPLLERVRSLLEIPYSLT